VAEVEPKKEVVAPTPTTKEVVNREGRDVVKTLRKSLNGKRVDVVIKQSDIDRGYAYKTVNGKRYKIDVVTGNLYKG
jgi:hypothetical protein